MTDMLMPQSEVSSNIARIRLAAGSFQGCILYFLYHASRNQIWPATDSAIFAPLLLIFGFIPIIFISGLGHLTSRVLQRWLVLATAIVAGLGFYDVWRAGGLHDLETGFSVAQSMHFPTLPMVIAIASGLFIAHALILAAAHDKRYIANYPSYFETAWKLLIQISFSVLFLITLWLVLWLGAALFMLVKLDFLKTLLQESWFAIPVTISAFSFAIHITDVRPAIVRGIRNLLLVLLSWILPVAVLIVGGFLLSLAFTGLTPLWGTRYATTILLGTAALLIILINATFQNGEVSADIARLLRSNARIAAFLLLPITTIAIYSLSLRVQEYGWTNDRITAASCLIIAACYTLGYVWAALQKHGWLISIPNVNIATAFIVLGVLTALFTPLADPARLSVAHQLNRLKDGRISASQFDFDYLKFNGARYGITALQQLGTVTKGADAATIREKSRLALQKANRWIQPAPQKITATDLHANILFWTDTTTPPDSFFDQDWHDARTWQLPSCMKQEDKKCDAYLIDFTHDNKPEILLIGNTPGTGATIFTQNGQQKWVVLSVLPYYIAGCDALRLQLRQGNYQLLTPPLDNIQIGDQLITLTAANSTNTCIKK